MRSYTRVTKDIFDACKLLIRNGAMGKECATALKISESAVTRIRKAENWEEYLEALKGIAEKQKQYDARKKASEHAVKDKTARPSAAFLRTEDQIYRLIEVVKEQNEILKGISAKLAFVVEELA